MSARPRPRDGQTANPAPGALVSRYAGQDMFIDPTFPNLDRTADASVVEILFLTGRTAERKRSLCRAIAAGAAAGGFRPDDVMVALVENEPIDWSLGRGEAYEKPEAE